MDANIHNDAGNCLSSIGETAVPALLPLLTNKDPDVRFYAGQAVRGIVPHLAYLVGSDENETNRCRIVGELAEIGGTDPNLTGALTDALKDKSFLVRSAATNALKRIDAAEASKAGVK
jgi:HEAT repeat protein